ncbi:unnamed protein product, partial [Musa textilis]
KRNLVFFSIAVGKALSSFSVWCYKKQLKFQNSLLFLSHFMGCGFSRMSSSTPPELAVDAAFGDATSAEAAASAAGVGPGSIQYTAELSSYEAACRLDPELQTFDATLQQRTSRAISTLALGVE